MSRSHASSRAPRRASVESIEQFQFRDAPSRVSSTTSPPPPAYTRLYAQGVDLLEHKDSVFRQFGLHKSAFKEQASAGGSSISPRASLAAAAQLQRTATSHQILQAPAATSAAIHRHSKQLQAKERCSSASYVSGRRVAPTGAAMAPTFSFRSTMESRMLVSPKAANLPSRRNRATSSLYAASMKPGATSFSFNSQRQSNNNSSSGGNPRASPMKNVSHRAAPAKRPMNSDQVATNFGSNQGQQRSGLNSKAVNKRCSFQAPHAGNQQHQPQQQQQQFLKAGSRRDSMTPSKRPSVRMGVPTMSSASENPPVLIQVSRRTSSPIITPSVAEFGMRKRPSVSPIPTLQPGTESYAPQPRVSILMRRDSKMDRLVEQISVLKATLGLSDEDLQWKVESTKGNAFLAAERHLNEGEERYDRLEYEVQLLSQTPCEEVSSSLVKQVRALMQQSQAISDSKPKLAACQNDITRLKKELLDARIAVELDIAKASPSNNPEADQQPAVVSVDPTSAILQQLEDAKAQILQIQEQLNDDISTLNDMLLALSSETDRLAKTCAEFKFMSPEVADVSNQLITILRRIPECSGDKLLIQCEQAIATAQKLRGSRLRDLKKKETDLAKTMKDIEVWKARRDQAKEFPFELAKREHQWKVDNVEDNSKSLKLLRGYVAQDVQQLNVDAIIARAQSSGVLFTYDLAIYVKQNRFLHWLVTHESDVARDNFLAIECAAWFLNFVAYDIHELRAFSAIFPQIGFDFDKDGKKADWKLQFMDHVYALVKQQKGEKVKAGWDPVRRARGEVKLKPLSDKQLLNAVYRYPSEAEIKTRIDKFELQRKRMDLKRDKHQSLENELIPAAKAEYLAIAEDARSEELQRSFGKATLIKMRDDAKQNFQTLSKTRDLLKSEIEHSEKQWRALCPTYEQFLDEAAKIRALDPQTREARIRGPFPQVIELKPRERAAFKKLSVEEEAQARRLELDNAIASRGKEISDAAESQAQVAADGTATGEGPGVTQAGDGAIGGSIETGTPDSQPGSDSAGTGQQDDSGTAPPQQRGSFRRVKSLQVSSEVLKFLQQDFCNSGRVSKLAAGVPNGGGAASKTPTAALHAVTAAVKIKRFASEQSIDLRSLSEDSSSCVGTPLSAWKPVVPAAPVRPKSKALLLLLEKEQSQAAAAGADDAGAGDIGRPPSPVKMNMFSELQSRFKKKPSDLEQSKELDEKSDLSVLKPPAKKPAAMSFLDELKSKATRKKTPVSPSEASSSPSPPLTEALYAADVPRTSASRPPPAPKSFLDELRARSRSVDS